MMLAHRFIWIAAAILASSPTFSAPSQVEPKNDVLWQLGKADDSSAEFANAARSAASNKGLTVDIPADWQTRADWSFVPNGLHGDSAPALDIHFTVPDPVPQNGVMLSVKLLQAPKSGPQMAVFSNGMMAGILQFWGTAETTSPYYWKRTYQLYIPPELLKPRANTLRLETVHPMWSDARVDRQIWWEWDYLKLQALAAPAREPIHGAVAYLGTTVKHGSNGFKVTEDTVKLARVALPWLGIAYSGNTIRADFWADVSGQQPARLEYLEALRDLNMTVCVDNVSGSHFHNGPDGKMPASTKSQLDAFFRKYGSLFQYYETGNEPCMFGGGFAETIETARYVNQIKPPTLKTAAPGWAYGGGKGTPRNWDAGPARRRQVEALCQVINGHSYGYSYADNRGGSFVDNLDTYRGVEDGWPKESLTSETGTNNWHSEENGTRFPSTQPHAQAFDRILRAHLAVVTRTMQHALIFDDFGLFKAPTDPADLTTISAYPGVNGEDTRLKTFRRLALAYATHGFPLSFTYRNPDAVTGKKVYFRAVDTASLAALPGSGGLSGKILLNFVNFEPAPQTMQVRVRMPAPGVYHGERFGPGDTYAAAHSTVDLKADPFVDLDVELGAGDAVQYILDRPATGRPYPPLNVRAIPGDGRVTVRWSACFGADGYRVQRWAPDGSTRIVGFTRTTSENPTELVDTGLENGRQYDYSVSAQHAEGDGDSPGPAQQGTSIFPIPERVKVTVGIPASPANLTAIVGDRQVTLSWGPVPTAAIYRLGRSDKAIGVFPTLAEKLYATTFTDTGLANDTTYHYLLWAINQFGESDPTGIEATPEAPPAAITNLKATAGDGMVLIQWISPLGAQSFTVARLEARDGMQIPISAEVFSPEFADNTAANGRVYGYTVRPKNSAAEGSASEQVSATPSAEPLPNPWRQSDIGKVAVAGKATQNSRAGTITVQGAGSDIWGPADSLHFAYLPLHGDGALTARAIHFDSTNEWAKIGVMIRQSVDAGSPMAIMAITPGKGSGFTHRDKADGPCDMAGGAGHPWLRIVRKGDSVTGFVSDDGQAWSEFGAATIPMAADTLIGLGVCSHIDGTLNKALFGDVIAGP